NGASQTPQLRSELGTGYRLRLPETTAGQTAPPPPLPPAVKAGPRKVGVFIGISEYASPQIRKLKVPHLDAKAAMDAFKQKLALDDALCVLNADASKSALRELLSDRLPATTRPGDTVIIYWA